MHLIKPKPITPFICIGVTFAWAMIANVAIKTLDFGYGRTRILLIVVFILMLWLSLWLIKSEGCRGMQVRIAFLAVMLSLSIRILCLDYASLDYVSFLSQWAEFFRIHGGFDAIKYQIGDYNVPYLYLVAAISYLPFPDLYLFKIFSILWDVLLAWGVFRLVRSISQDTGTRKPLIAFVLALFLPTVMLNGAYWGQCDSVYGALVVHAVNQLIQKKHTSSVLILAIAFSFKLQTIFLVPLWGVAWASKQLKFRKLWWFPAVYLVTCFPALMLGKPMEDILSVYFGQMEEYASRLTLNAPSVFQFIPYGFQGSSENLKNAGIAIAFILVFVLLAVGFLFKEKVTTQACTTMAVIMAIGVPFFLPHMHDRYFFLADVLTLGYAFLGGWRRSAICVLTQLSSLACYRVYLQLQYNWVININGTQFLMAGEALMMCAALCLSFWQLGIEFKSGGREELP